ncbi:MAG: hypothetical protein FJZ09_06435 [Candidatus Omnitrophica bacterium]|nr:hypothetical protein [Candidatus Omnitrophota bacterium]
MARIRNLFFILLLFAAAFFILSRHFANQRLEKAIERLSADSRIAEILVTQVKTDPKTRKARTTIKFLEYDTRQRPLAPRYFAFSGNTIQLQSLVMRFDDFYVKKGHPLKGRSAYIFMKAFSLNGSQAEVYEINNMSEVPSGYKTEGKDSAFDNALWKRFWDYALKPDEAKRMGIKNAQIEAPGTRFIPGMLYTVKIEHDGGMRIDARPLPGILKGEKINF